MMSCFVVVTLCVNVCVVYLCVRRGSKYFKVVSDWLILVADLYGTILVGGTLWTHFDDIVVLEDCFLCFTFSKYWFPNIW